ncbi:MAG: 2-oxoglutarate dehydrogenase E1 component [Proteobacteria bacterium]|nr:2-oxoglutarate dehydrogenase E1 component [Pseudomonadota bacterium]
MRDFKKDTYLFGHNAHFIDELFDAYCKDPSSVDASWAEVFQSMPRIQKLHPSNNDYKLQRYARSLIPENTNSTENIYFNIAAHKLLNAYKDFGHTAVDFNSLQGKSFAQASNLLKLEEHMLSKHDLVKNVVTESGDQKPLSELLERFKIAYASSIAAEFTHLENLEERNWIAKQLEEDFITYNFSSKEKIAALDSLIEVTLFEEFLHKKFIGAKRFSIEGLESAILFLEVIIKASVELNTKSFVIGMAHRGRISALAKIAGKKYEAIFSEFYGIPSFPDHLDVPGDVKYHMGSSNCRTLGQKSFDIELLPNPSHLEAVNSVLLGRVRAKQDLIMRDDCKREVDARSAVLGITVHGDAAIVGQGAVSESLISGGFENCKIGGGIHLIINNQLGFTANASATKPGRYCTDIAKSINAPIFHVSATNIRSVVYTALLASRYRAKFKKDVFVDIIGYRKYGHNETDEPMFTQPIIYSKISKLKNSCDVYADELIAEKIIDHQEYDNKKTAFINTLQNSLDQSKNYKQDFCNSDKSWSGFVHCNSNDAKDENTGFNSLKLTEFYRSIVNIPQSFNANAKISKQMQKRLDGITKEGELDWAAAETLAMAALLDEGYNIRLTGQDVERGTFSHRHSVLIDQKNEDRFIPLNHLKNNQKANLEVFNSYLSELGVLGFEYGYSTQDPNCLVIWEAQFGDFANGAQVMIDQFIASGRAKWLKESGIVLLLPHGYEGQGPEHSSARLERFLQLSADNNMQVVNCTTPASFFHVLRRQMHRNYRIPLVVMSPKSLLRHKLVVSKIKDVDVGTKFLPVLEDNDAGDIKNITALVFVSGKIYYDLYLKRIELGDAAKHVAIVRIEQLYPFPSEDIKQQILKYSGAKIIWCQEEHKNMGAYSFMKLHLEELLEQMKKDDVKVHYVGRKASASTAAGNANIHTREQENIMNTLFNM